MSVIVSLVDIASKVATPLSLAGVGLSLFFGAVYLFAQKANWKAIPGAGTLKLLMAVITYAFVLSLTALVLGIAAWSLTYFIGPMIAENRVSDYYGRKDYRGTIAAAEPYIAENPRDDIVRNRLGTSYYATGKYEEGVKLYSDMLALYATKEDCSPQKAAALSSLAVFNAKAGRMVDGLATSRRLIKCPNVTEPFIYNHILLEAENGEEVTLPDDFDFKDSYWQSKYSLLKYVKALEKASPNDAAMIDLLGDAYCDDEKTKTILNGRFNTGDFAASPLLVQDFEYETGELDRLPNGKKIDFETQLKKIDCLARK